MGVFSLIRKYFSQPQSSNQSVVPENQSVVPESCYTIPLLWLQEQAIIVAIQIDPVLRKIIPYAVNYSNILDYRGYWFLRIIDHHPEKIISTKYPLRTHIEALGAKDNDVIILKENDFIHLRDKLGIKFPKVFPKD